MLYIQIGFIITSRTSVSTGDAHYHPAEFFFFPIAGFLYIISFFAQPRRQDRRTFNIFWAHFIGF